MPTHFELLLREEWKSKRLEILARDSSKCVKCKNFNLLSDSLLGYIKKDIQGELMVGLNINGLSNASIKGIEYDSKGVFKNLGTTMIFIKDKEQIRFNRQKNYIVYFEKTDTSYFIIAIAEIDSTGNEFPKFYHSKNDNPFRKKDFIANAKFVQTRGLHIHHSFYQEGKEPWEYPSDSLTTLCWHCHEELHKETKIPYLNIAGEAISEFTPCSRCLGIGYFPEYKHVENGECFRCKGAKFEEYLK